METSPNPNSQLGTNGPEETQEKLPPTLLNKPSRKRPKPVQDSESEQEVAEVADVSANSEVLSPSDMKLAIKMNRHIMSVLGLNKRSRSFKV